MERQEEEERELKRRKKELIFSEDILFEITKYIDTLKDFISLSSVNKFFRNYLLKNKLPLNEILKRNEISLKNNLPNYLFKIEYLNLKQFENHNFNLLNEFKEIKSLFVWSLPNNFLFNFRKIKELYIYKTNINKSLLNLSSELINLTIGDCQIVKEINFEKFTKLNSLNLFECFNIPENCLKNLNQLKKLTVYDNYSITDDFLNGLINLEEFYIKGCSFTGIYLQNFKNLKILDITDSNINDEALLNLNNLKELKLYNCRNILGNCLQNLIKLEKLILQTCSAMKNINQYLNNLTNLKYLKIYFCSSDEFLTSNSLQNLTNLEYLEIRGKEFYDKDFCNLTKLKTLKITKPFTFFDQEKNLTGSFLPYLTNLEILDCNFIVEEKYCKNLKHLKTLSLLKIDNVISEDLSYLKNIKTISLFSSFSNKITDRHLQQLTNFISLNLDHQEEITGECLINMINLTRLKVNATKIKDEHLMNLTKLKYLDISDCKNLIGNCLFNLSQLEELKISRTQVNDEHLENLINLKELHAFECVNLNSGKFLLNMNELSSFFFEKDMFIDEQIEELRKLVRNEITLREYLAIGELEYEN
ncbi:hypothetical protein ABK040_003753 [Willaertia magna]